MAIDRVTKGSIISRWVGMLGGVGLVGATGYGVWQFIQLQGGTGANPFDMAVAGLRVGIVGAIAGAGVGLVWGSLVALVRG